MDFDVPFGFGVLGLVSLVAGRLALVKLVPELMAVKLDWDLGVPRAVVSEFVISTSESLAWQSNDACRASLAWRASESPAVLGVGTFDRLIGLGAGLGVNGPPYSSSSC